MRLREDEILNLSVLTINLEFIALLCIRRHSAQNKKECQRI